MARLFGQRVRGRDVQEGPVPEPSEPKCERCGNPASEDALFQRYRVCSNCGHHHLLSAYERVALLADPASFKETRRNLYPTDPLGFVDRVPYLQRLDEARRRTGLADAAVTGTCEIEGRPAVLAVLDFRFLGGSMGSVVGEKIASACELAARRRLALVAVTASGGARMQEGMLALAQMAKTCAAVERLRSLGLPFIVLMTHPTTGGVYASFATQGDVLLAEPGAMVGFAGPRVAEAMAGDGSSGAKTAESLLEHGQIDAIVPRQKGKTVIAELLRLASGRHRGPAEGGPLPPPSGQAAGAWAAVERARHGDRPTSMDYLHRMVSSFQELRGDRAVGEDPAVVCGMADLDGQAVMVIAQERGHGDEVQRRGGRARPEGYRKAQRAMRLAARWGMPVLTLIDTPGADPGPESEAGGLGAAISGTMALMSDLPTPIVSVVIGEGGSGGALALAVADRVLMMENAIFSVIAPEGAAAIIYRDPGQAPSVAPALKLTSKDLLELGLIDGIVSEPEGGAHTDHERAALLLRRALREELAALPGGSISRLLRKRYDRWRQVGRTTTAAAAAAEHLAGQVESGLREGAHMLGELGKRLPGRH